MIVYTHRRIVDVIPSDIVHAKVIAVILLSEFEKMDLEACSGSQGITPHGRDKI